jgi:hypothetical protein
MGAVAPFLSVTVFAASMLVDVASSVARLSIVDEALLDRHRLLAWRWRFLVNRHLPLVLRWLRVLFSGHPSTSRGRALCLLSCRHME